MADAKKLTMEELRAKTAKAVKEATTFEKSPTLDMRQGMEIVFRVKKVVSGKFKDEKGAPMDLVIVHDVRVLNDGKFVSADLPAYLQDGLQGPRTSMTVKAGAEIRLPNFIVKRSARQGIDLHEKYVYWAKYLDDIKVPAGMFKRAAVTALGTDFPEA